MAAQAPRRVTVGVRHRALLAALILTWAVSWPLVKVGVAAMPPLWFACFRYGIATACLFAFAAMRRTAAVPPRADWALIAVSGALQMAAYSALSAFALTILPPGRASVLAFSTPVWVVPLAAWRLRERVSAPARLGIGLGVLGALVIASPALHPHGGRHVLAYALLLAAAVSWAISIVAVRAHRFTATTLALAPWQTLVAACLLLPIALAVEGMPPAVEARAALSLAFVGPVATAFAYWAVVEAGRQFSATTLSMALLATPAVGILISAVALGERIEPSLVAGALLVAAGIRLVLPRARAPGERPPASDAGRCACS